MSHPLIEGVKSKLGKRFICFEEKRYGIFGPWGRSDVSSLFCVPKEAKEPIQYLAIHIPTLAPKYVHMSIDYKPGWKASLEELKEVVKQRFPGAYIRDEQVIEIESSSGGSEAAHAVLDLFKELEGG